jgi:dTDP-glucose 4,6-dehydratase
MNAKQSYKKVLITGSGGFIFSNFIRKAIYENQPYKFISLDKVTKSTVLNNIYVNQDHPFYFGDISDAHFMNVLFEFERPSIVIHGAAETDVDKFFTTSNVLGTQTLINCCLKWDVEKLIYISDDKVYGQLGKSENPWVEISPLDPRDTYAASKASGELLVKAAHHANNLNYNIVRLSNTFGPRQPTRNLIPKVIKHIVNNEKIPLFGDGLQTRDWSHVYDVCSAILTVLNIAPPNESYNISSGQECTNLELVQKICNAMNRGHDLISFVEEKPPINNLRRSSNNTKIKELNWKPRFKFSDAILDAVGWFQRNNWALKQMS